MGSIPQYKELTDFSKRNAELGRRAYLLDVGTLPFGFLYVSPAIYTIAWNGALDFSQLESEALYNLPMHLSPEKIQLSPEEPKIRSGTEASLVLSGEFDKLVTYYLGNPTQYAEYRMALQNPGNVSFARHDVYNTWGGPLYSFTAENPQRVPTSDSELAVKLLKSHPFSINLLDWILARHAQGELLRSELDRESSVVFLLDLIDP